MNQSTQHDFDFLMGDWRVSHRRLKERLKGSDDWQEFAGTCSMHLLLGGSANADDNVLNFPGQPYRAVSLRTYAATSRRWSIWWLDSRSPHVLDVPVVGEFADGLGTFYADDTLEGRPVRVRFRWTDTGTASPMWEQAFSPDGGQTWEVNWTMRFDRR